MQVNKGFELRVNRNDLREAKIVDTAAPGAGDIEDGQAVLRIDRFSFTANNITYAVVGDSMHYWDFFPAPAGWGKVPCWGFADVVHSKHDDLQTGERLYGYFPMASHLVVAPSRVNKAGFYDASEHRRPLPVIYNHYQRTQGNSGYRPEWEGHISIFQPLFATSFLLDDFLAEQDFFGAEDIICTSASSKTSIAFAYLLHRHREERGIPSRITGFTSEGNVEFVEGLGIYDKVYQYDRANALPGDRPSMIVDFAGNKQLLLLLQDLLPQEGPNALKYASMIGLTHWEESSGEGSLRMPNSFFFAPTQAEKRRQDWGGDGLRDRMAADFIPFLQFTDDWMELIPLSGPDRLLETYKEAVDGRFDPAKGIVLTTG